MSEEVKTKSDPPVSKGKLFIERLNAYRNIILAVAALATAITSWFRPTDTTATKNSFEWTSKKIEELSANDLKTKEDLVALRNFLEGYVQAQRAVTPTPAAPVAAPVGLGSLGTLGQGAGSGSGAVAGSSRPTTRPPRRPAVQPPPDPVVAAPAPPPLPVMKANPQAIKRPKFEQVAAD